VDGHGGEIERVETYRGTTVKMELSEKVRLEIGVGDGKIFVLPVEKVYRIRTAEEDQAAVTPVG
jgi:nitrogen regulatory protein P-II 1